MRSGSAKRMGNFRWIAAIVSLACIAVGMFYVAAHNAAMAMAWGGAGSAGGAFAFADWIHDDTV